MRRIFVPPVFASEEQTQRARMLHAVVLMTMVISTVFLITIMIEQPAALLRSLFSASSVNLLGVVMLAVNRRGRTRMASVLFVTGIVLVLTILAPTDGGIRASAVTGYLVVALAAGVLLGERAGVVTALVCAFLGLGLVVTEELGFLPQSIQYNPITLWLLNSLFMGVVIVLLRLATQAIASALRRAESELSERKNVEQRLERALDAGAIGTWERDLSTAHFYGDDRTFALLGFPVTADRLLPFDTWKARVHPDDLPSVLSIIDRLARGEERASAEYRLVLPDGRLRYLAATASPIRNENGQIVRHVGTLIDVTERKEAEQHREQLESQLRQSQKMEALGTLAGGIAHDFNNLLAVIGSNAELGRADVPEGHPVRTSLDEIAKASGRAKDIVKQILLFSRGQQAERQPILLAPVVDDAIRFLRATLPANVQVRETIEPSLPPVSAAGSQIYQVIMNLGANAAHAMSKDGGVLSLNMDSVIIEKSAASPSPDLGPGRYVRITVEDNGTGMTRETLDHMFEPFFTTKGLAGTGLGLSVVHGIVRDHGGAITVESEPGRGTKFEVYLPAALSAAAQTAPETAGPVRGSGEHVMYIDDEEDLVFVAERVLERLGYRCSAYSDPNAALQAFRTNPDDFDAVVTDMMMPAMTGLELAQALKAIRPNLPVAFTSGRWDRDSDDDLTQGAVWIHKPATVEELSQALRGLLQRAN